MSSISSTERKYISNGIEQNIRNDGRERLDYRAFTLETNCIPQANGSCRLHIESTDVLVGVKVELGEPDFNTPNSGKIIASVDWYVRTDSLTPTPSHAYPLALIDCYFGVL